MNRTEFIAAIATILFGAFLLGWIVSRVFGRLTRPTRADMNELDKMAQQLHDAESARDKAVAKLEERESELLRRIAGQEIDLQTTMDALRESRVEVEELRAYIDQKLTRR